MHMLFVLKGKTKNDHYAPRIWKVQKLHIPWNY